MSLNFLLGIFAGGLSFFAYGLYMRNIVRGNVRPNAATLLMWLWLASMSAISYARMSGDWIKAVIPMVNMSTLVVTVAYSFWKGRVTKLSSWDKAAMSVGLAAMILWLTFRSAALGNLLMQPCIVIAFVPRCRDVWRDPHAEKATPWFIWGIAYLVLIFVVALRWRGQPQDLVYPINTTILHTMVGVLALRTQPIKK